VAIISSGLERVEETSLTWAQHRIARNTMKAQRVTHIIQAEFD